MTMGKLVTRRAFAGFALSASAAILLGATGCGRSEEAPSEAGDAAEEERPPSTVGLSIAVDPVSACPGALIARAKGYFAESNITLELSEDASEADVLERVQAGECEYGVVGQETLAAAFGADEPYSVLAIAALEQPQAEVLSGQKTAPYPLLLIANDLYLVRRAEEACLVISALKRGYAYIGEHVDAAAEAVADQTGADVRQAKEALEGMQPLLVGAARAWGAVEQEPWDAYFREAHEAGIARNGIPAHHGYSMDYLVDGE